MDDLGLDSLSMISLEAELNELYGVDVQSWFRGEIERQGAFRVDSLISFLWQRPDGEA